MTRYTVWGKRVVMEQTSNEKGYHWQDGQTTVAREGQYKNLMRAGESLYDEEIFPGSEAFSEPVSHFTAVCV